MIQFANFVNMSKKMQIKLMLQGSENLTLDENIRIFNHVISFIGQTERLSGKFLTLELFIDLWNITN